MIRPHRESGGNIIVVLPLMREGDDRFPGHPRGPKVTSRPHCTFFSKSYDSVGIIALSARTRTLEGIEYECDP